MTDRFNELKRAALEKYFSHLNPPQRQAVFKVKGPLLILAGAGSGKTTVLINRIAYMIRFGNAYAAESTVPATDGELKALEDYIAGSSNDGAGLADIISYSPVRPWNILAITFTNKAAGELRSRIENMLGDEGSGITACTFHSLCARLLRRECGNIGFLNNFTIYDTDDSLRVVKAVMKEFDINDKLLTPKTVLGQISKHKESMSSPEDALAYAGDFQATAIAKVYKAYQSRLYEANAMDFDDLLCHTVKLFESFPDVLDHYQNLYKYIMVDEYQDTNTVQFRLVKLLAEKYGNLCVVGDDDQSIYRFRGATIENILSFEKVFGCDPKHDVIRLEQNYRSTQNILTCANVLISHNTERKGKNLWTDAGDGNKVVVYTAADEHSEARFIADTVTTDVEDGGRYNDHAVLYRTNAQSRELELALSKSGIPYRIFGGLKFYDRKEIRDVLAYLQVINNESDMLRLRRIINEPKRGIGEATVTAVEQITSDLGISPIEVMLESEDLAPITKRSGRLRPLAELFRYFADLSESVSLAELLDEVLDKTGYRQMLENDGDEGTVRLENIEELKSSMAEYENNAEEPTLSGYLEEISLYTDLDQYNENDDYVALMTIHSAKGLEFPCVFVAGMEDNLFPSQRSMESESEVQEERRLAYVAYTRAKTDLYLIHARRRMLYGSFQHNRPSQFLREILNSWNSKSCLEQHEDPMLDFEEHGSSGRSGSSQRANGLEEQLRQRMAASAAAPGETNFTAGERIRHKIFGEGTVLKVTQMANDALLEIAFDSRGTKKVMAKFTKLEKL